MKRRKIVLAMKLLLISFLFIFSGYAFGANQVNTVLDRLFHGEFLATIGGLKPFSWVPLKPGEAEMLAQAREVGLIKTAKVDWVVSKTKEFVLVYNPVAVEELLADSKKMGILRDLGFQFKSAQEVIEAMKAFVSLRPQSTREHVLFGLAMGYPSEEVLLFSDELKNGVPSKLAKRKIINISTNKDFHFGSFAILSGKDPSSKEFIALQGKAEKIISQFHDEYAKGKTATDVFNDWHLKTSRPVNRGDIKNCLLLVLDHSLK